MWDISFNRVRQSVHLPFPLRSNIIFIFFSISSNFLVFKSNRRGRICCLLWKIYRFLSWLDGRYRRPYCRMDCLYIYLLLFVIDLKTKQRRSPAEFSCSGMFLLIFVSRAIPIFLTLIFNQSSISEMLEIYV